jgi:hypothetical protein
MRNVELHNKTGVTVGARKSGEIAVMWDESGEIEWLDEFQQDLATITPRH